MKPTIDDLAVLARQAGEILRAGARSGNHIDLKSEIDLVTEIDRQSEEFLLKAISEQFPGDRIVAEESGGLGENSDRVWYIDPLDGTTNFAHGLPIYSVSIGYAVSGEMELGVVYDPGKDELFSAVRGEGAWLNGEGIQTGKADDLSRSLVVTGFPYDRFVNPDNNLENFTRMALKARGVRRLGSAALDLCYVGCGWVDGYWEIRLEAWDLAAGMLVAREAGAKVTKRDGGEDMLEKPYSVVAANPILHGLILEVIE